MHSIGEMGANANPRLDAVLIGREIREVIALCAKNGLSYGELKDLIEFLRALNRNKLLAMNFWSLVAQMSNKEGASTLDPDWILAVIVEGVTGRPTSSVCAAGSAYRLLIDRLRRMLAGEDVRFCFPDVVPARRSEDGEQSEVRKPMLVEPADVPLRNLATLDEEPDRGANPKLRLVFDPEQEAANESTDDELGDEIPVARMPLHEDAKQPIPAPLLAHSAESQDRASRSWQPIGLLCLLCLVGWLSISVSNSSIWQRLDASLHAGYASAAAAWKGQDSATQGVSTPTGDSRRGVLNPDDAAQQVGEEAGSKQLVPVRSSVSTGTQRTNESRPSASFHNSPERVRVPASDSQGRVVVPASTMREHLISSRVPIFPEGARAQHARGPVVVQAVITTEGSVGHLNVLGGDPALQHAAMEAVATWRYRPYLINGRPANVVTTISVPFPKTP